MKIYDISQELFSSRSFPGDKPATFEKVSEIAKGAVCNITALKMNVHNGTHVDAPCHFIDGGKTIDEMPLDRFIGDAKVVIVGMALTAEEIDAIMADVPKKVLLKGDVELTEENAEQFVQYGIELLGIQSQSIGPVSNPQPVHMILLGAEVIALEGLNLQEVPDGNYFLNAAPLHLKGSDGAPCRAVLIEF